MKSHHLAELPRELQETLLQSHTLKNQQAYRSASIARRMGKQDEEGVQDLFSMFQEEPAPTVEAEVHTVGVTWATDGYSEQGKAASAAIEPEDLHLIIPRVEKAKEEQKRRTKDKAEVFTPSWVCNLQNNLIDDAALYPGAFNTATVESKSWTPTLEPIHFADDGGWLKYVVDRRLEMTAGEAPYLMSRYDTVSGAYIPVRNSEGAYGRIGLLDRKFRVIAEQKPTEEEWIALALAALRTTYGYEWQGDNLLLARLNMFNSFVDYHRDYLDSLPDGELLTQVAELTSWQLWQMDGLKMVLPDSCSAACQACEGKKRVGHDGLLPLIRWGSTLRTFEDFLPPTL